MTLEQTQELQDDSPKYQLGLQSSQIQNAFEGHGLSTTIVGGSRSKRSLRSDLHSHLVGGLRHIRRIKSELKKTIGVESVRLQNEAGDLRLQVIRPYEPAVPLLDLIALMPNLPPSTAILGFSEEGSPVVHNFSTETQPNILISGQADAGKTTLLRTIAASLSITSNQSQIQLLAINPVSADRQRLQFQDSSLISLNHLPHMLTDVAVRQTEITELILFLVREMSFRMENNFSIPRLVVLIDHAATVMEHGGRTVVESLEMLMQRGKDAGIHLVLSTRRPGADVFSPVLRSNLQERLVGRRDTLGLEADQAELADGDLTALLGEGDFIAASSSRRLRFQAAYIDDVDLHIYLSRVYQKRPILLAKPLGNLVKSEQETSIIYTPAQQYSLEAELVSAT